MSKKSPSLSAAERKQIDVKFSTLPAQLVAELSAPAKTAVPKKAGKRKPAAGKSGPALATMEAWGEPERKVYADFPVGKIEGEPYLVWVKPDIFRLEPQPKPFRFIRGSGEIIQPGRMFTDGGSIPRAFGVFSDKLSPWGYAPAFLIHDWLFDCHHAGTTDKSFEEVRDIMMESIKTLMETRVCEFNRLTFDLIHAGIDSFVARRVWDGKK